MKIIKTNIENLENEKKMLYRLTKGTSISFKNMTDEELDRSWPVNAFVIYEDTSRSGNTSTLISILSDDAIIGGQSKSFIDSFLEIVDIMGDDDIAIHVNKFISRQNRTFYTASLDC